MLAAGERGRGAQTGCSLLHRFGGRLARTGPHWGVVHPGGLGLTPLLSTASAGRGGSPFPSSRAGFGRLTLHVPPGLALAFHDGSVHIVHRLSLQTMAIFYSSAAPRSVDEPAIKRPRTTGPAVHFKAMQLSWTSLALVGIDNHGRVSAVPGGPRVRRGPRAAVCGGGPRSGSGGP